MKVLVIEDEQKLSDVIVESLKKENYIVVPAYDGITGEYEALTDSYDLIILDLMLPKKSGMEILKEIKKNNINSKVILLTAKNSLEDKLEGFKLGIDDYVTKPFFLEELIARINTQLRKTNKTLNNVITFNDISLNTKTRVLKCQDEEIDVPGKEYSLLEYLINNNKQILSRDDIYNKVWGLDNEAISNNLEAYLSFLRKKLKLIGSSTTIKAIRGLGYKLEVSHEEIKD